MRSFFHGFQLDKVRAAYHKSCQKEQTALDKEKQANEDAEMSPEKKEKLAGAREKATGEKLKVSREVKTGFYPKSLLLQSSDWCCIRMQICGPIASDHV